MIVRFSVYEVEPKDLGMDDVEGFMVGGKGAKGGIFVATQEEALELAKKRVSYIQSGGDARDKAEAKAKSEARAAKKSSNTAKAAPDEAAPASAKKGKS